MLVELQALVTSNKYGTVARMTQGVDSNRVALLMAMLEKRVGMNVLADDVFLNVAGGSRSKSRQRTWASWLR